MTKKLIRIGLIMLSVILAVSAFAACSEKFDENKAIVVVSREETSGSRKAFMELVFGKNFEEIEMPAAYVRETSYSAVFSKIKTDPQAIGYDSYGFVTDDVKMLTVDGVACSSDTYKMMRPFSVVYSETRVESDLNKKFLEFLTSAKAQEMIDAEGLTADSTRTTAYTVQDGLSGEIKVSGGSTVKIIVDILVEEFIKLQPGVTVVVSGSNSGGGRNDVKNNLVDFGMIGAELSDAEKADMETGGITVGKTRICIDKIAITVNKKNPITNITTEQLKNIYNGQSETKYNNWAELIAAQKAA